jgi:predicted amidohydrolase YtcJ
MRIPTPLVVHPARAALRFAVGLAVLLVACEPPEGAPFGDVADLVLLGGKIVTVDESRPEAEAMAVRDHRILAMGTDDEIRSFIGPDTETIELDGRLAVPGFIEGHGHYMGLGRALQILDLTQVGSWEEIVDMVARAVETTEPGQWIEGRGWHQERWDPVPQPNVDGVALHHELSAVSPENPVLLGHASGHAAFANALAMELAGIHRDTPDPPGGTIVKDEDGEPTGLLRETAQRLVSRVVDESRADRSPEEVEAEWRERVRLAGQEALSKGVTSFHDAGSDFETIDFFRTLAAEGALPVRLYVMVRRETNEAMAERLAGYRIIPEGNDFLAVRSIKRQIDGAMGPHGAWLLEPYADLPESTGLVLESVEDIEETARIAVEHGFQVNTHAIGDRANREVLDLYERAFAEAGVEGGPLRWRVEHAQHVQPEDVPRFAELGVIASMQGNHCTSDGPWVPQRLGEERARITSYLWRDLLDSGAVVTNGTDAPVEDIDPLGSFYASVTRRMAHGETFHPEQSMTREEALLSYTLSNAYAAFDEDRLGSLAPGKLADVVVLSHDIMSVPEDQILEARVDLTILGGEVVHRR